MPRTALDHAAASVATLVALAVAAPIAAQPAADRIDGPSGPIAVETFARGLVHPWGAAFLPDGRLLVTERPGRLRLVSRDGAVSEPLAGTPDVFARGQGGLLDVALDPDFAENRLVYLTFADPRGDGAATSAGRGRLSEDGRALEGFETIFEQRPAVSGENHFGGRLAFAPDATLFVTLGERFDYAEEAQDVSNTLGTIVRLAPDGAIPPDNPFVGRDGEDAIWSFGHRNVEAAALHPQTGALHVAEMGPEGGDELNRPEAGRNYGWPLVSWGRHYSGEPIPDPPTRPRLAHALLHWTPVISPSGATFYTGDLFPAFAGDLLIGGLTAQGIVRVDVAGEPREVGRLALGVRTRDVVQGPQGAIFVLTDQPEGEILRLTPAEP
ncbi:PQQ-dependent sugar dehydrogenase [Salinarimonas sp.]|uniref:PQQ-dependent sugar dehydrogenase n=1 Tax=Salinarimonas sp. TaxID=2766526 RepID=UPI0032D8B6A0